LSCSPLYPQYKRGKERQERRREGRKDKEERQTETTGHTVCIRKILIIQAQWLMPVIPATQEVETG
jgi:hypothetical protein